MAAHTVTIAPNAGSPDAGADLRFATPFNAAVPFIDRHEAEGRGGKAAIRTTAGEEVSYAALAAAVNRYGNAFAGLGIAPGERLLMVVKDCPNFFFVFWGAIKAGIVPVPLNTLLTAKDYRYMIDDSAAAAIVWSPEYDGAVREALAAARHRPAHLLPQERAAGLAADMPESLAPHPAAADDDCFWLYSSGSTGFPKGAIHRHRDMVATSRLYGIDVLGVREDDICFSAAKLFFAYGLGNAMTFPLWAGATAVLAADRPTPEMTFDIFARFRPTLYFGVPTLYAAQLAALDGGADCDMASVRWCVSAGEALPADIFRRWRERTGTTILDGIGSTEALHIFISNRPDMQKPGSSGTLVPGYEARIVGEGGRPVAVGTPGALQIRGPSTARGYWNLPEKTAATMLEGGWLDTGDTYRIDDDGCYVYEGRSDDMMKVGGIWTSPAEIEACLIGHAKVLEAAVVGREDDAGLIKPEAWIVRADGATGGEAALQQELHDHVKAGLAPYKYPRWWRFVDALPKTATGKIQRFRLRAGPGAAPGSGS